MGNPTFFIVAIFFYLCSIALFITKKNKWAIGLLMLATFFIRLYVSSLYPYLNDWDERFHALVGKNMLLNPFRPTLYHDPILKFDVSKWDKSYIWVHKEPLFMWLIGLSVKLFGVNELAVRIPSFVLISLLVPVAFRIGSLLRNDMVGYIAALLISSNMTSIILCSGAMGMDHNDIHFMFFVTVSIWCWIEYELSKKIKWIILIGLFAGCAILVKWLVGLLVFFIWGCYMLFFSEKLFSKKNIIPMLSSLLVTMLVAIPWHIWIFYKYPAEASYEIGMFSSRFGAACDDVHVGAWYFYLVNLVSDYSLLILCCAIAIMLLIQKIKYWQLQVCMLLGAIFVYAFFSVASTKTPAYVFVVHAVVIYFIAVGMEWIVVAVRSSNKYLHFVLFAVVLISSLQLRRIYIVLKPDESCWWVGMRQRKINNTAMFKTLTGKLNPKKDVVIYCTNREELDFMFYTDCTAYGEVDSSQMVKIINSGKKVYAFNTKRLPNFVTSNSRISILPGDYLTSEY